MSRKWTADELLEEIRGYGPACLITAAADLDLFTALARGPATADRLAARIGADPRATAVLLDALAALELLVKRGDGYEVPADVAELLVEDSPANILPAVRHQGNCLRRWAQLARVVQTGRPPQGEPSIRGPAADCESFIGAMNNFTQPIAPRIVEKVFAVWHRHPADDSQAPSPCREESASPTPSERRMPPGLQRLLDIGGASGTWTIAFLLAVPDATGVLFDLPEVVPLARERLTRAGLADRVTLVAGDYNTDELPGGADFAWLSAIVHQNSRAQNRALYARIYRALAAGGTLVIRDIVMEASRTRPPAGALFAVTMLVGTEGGGTFTFEEFQDDLAAAGFVEVEWLHQDPGMDSLVRARKP